MKGKSFKVSCEHRKFIGKDGVYFPFNKFSISHDYLSIFILLTAFKRIEFIIDTLV